MNKLTDFGKFMERVDDDTWSSLESDWSEDYMDEYDKEYYGHHHKNDDDDDYNTEDGMENVKYLLRTMFKNRGIENYSINSKKYDISITITMRSKERLSDVVMIFDILKKLKKDILPQYESEFDMWTNRKNEQIFEALFLYEDDYEDDEENDDLDNDKMPF